MYRQEWDPGSLSSFCSKRCSNKCFVIQTSLYYDVQTIHKKVIPYRVEMRWILVMWMGVWDGMAPRSEETLYDLQSKVICFLGATPVQGSLSPTSRKMIPPRLFFEGLLDLPGIIDNEGLSDYKLFILTFTEISITPWAGANKLWAINIEW